MFVRGRAVQRIAKEKVLYERRPGGDISVCVVYPNIYRLGMANLGYQSIYHIFETDPRVAADRALVGRASLLANRLLLAEQHRPLEAITF